MFYYIGIIIDTFSMLRDQENEKIKDIRQICFICGQNQEVFDRKVNLKGGFVSHINVFKFNFGFRIINFMIKIERSQQMELHFLYFIFEK